jgi:hypothetical protein
MIRRSPRGPSVVCSVLAVTRPLLASRFVRINRTLRIGS